MGAEAHLLAAAVAALALGCTLENPSAPPPALDYATFECRVMPVLARECSFPACHGSPERRLRLLSPGRMRLADQYPEARATLTDEELHQAMHPALTPAELAYNYAQMRAFTTPDPQRSQLLIRPLPSQAGGIHHAAGADVFPSNRDPGYDAIASWLEGVEGCP